MKVANNISVWLISVVWKMHPLTNTETFMQVIAHRKLIFLYYHSSILFLSFQMHGLCIHKTMKMTWQLLHLTVSFPVRQKEGDVEWILMVPLSSIIGDTMIMKYFKISSFDEIKVFLEYMFLFYKHNVYKHTEPQISKKLSIF